MHLPPTYFLSQPADFPTEFYVRCRSFESQGGTIVIVPNTLYTSRPSKSPDHSDQGPQDTGSCNCERDSKSEHNIDIDVSASLSNIFLVNDTSTSTTPHHAIIIHRRLFLGYHKPKDSTRYSIKVLPIPQIPDIGAPPMPSSNSILNRKKKVFLHAHAHSVHIKLI